MGVITFAIVKFVAWKPVKLRLQSNVADMVYYSEPIFFFQRPHFGGKNKNLIREQIIY